MADIERSDFEKWARHQDIRLDRGGPNDDYRHFEARMAWEAWQAALDSQAQVAENKRLMKYAEAIREAWLFSDLSNAHSALLRELYVSITGDAP